MKKPPINHVVFDIGNVFVTWSPEDIVLRTFGDTEENDQHVEQLFKGEHWRDLNKGHLTEAETIAAMKADLGYDQETLVRLFGNVRESLTPIPGTEALLHKVLKADYSAYALTDNVHEIVEYLQERYDFWPHFHGVVVSAEVKTLKPDPVIYEHLLNRHDLDPARSVFIDDMLHNVEGARAVGMHAIQFTTAEACERELQELGLVF